MNYLKKNSLLFRDNRFTSIYKNKRFLKGKRQPSSLKKLLTKAKFTNIDIEILFCVEYCTTCSISPVGLLLRQTRIKNIFKKTSITACTYMKQYYKTPSWVEKL